MGDGGVGGEGCALVCRWHRLAGDGGGGLVCINCKTGIIYE